MGGLLTAERWIRLAAGCLFILVISLPVQAGEVQELPNILNFQKRDAQQYRIELSPYFGDYVGDILRHSILSGAHADVRLSPAVSLGADVGWSQIEYDPTDSFGRIATDDNLYAVQGVFTYNMPAAFPTNGSVIKSDFFTTLGGGVLRINRSYRGDGFIGGGMKVYTPWARWFGLRIEIRNYFSSLQTAAGTRFTSDVSLMLGPTFMLPPKL